jgi:hypothetical protein
MKKTTKDRLFESIKSEFENNEELKTLEGINQNQLENITKKIIDLVIKKKDGFSIENEINTEVNNIVGQF